MSRLERVEKFIMCMDPNVPFERHFPSKPCIAAYLPAFAAAP